MKKQLAFSSHDILVSLRPIVQQGAEVKAMERSDGMVVTVTCGGKDSPGKFPANLVFSQLKNVSDPAVFSHIHTCIIDSAVSKICL